MRVLYVPAKQDIETAGTLAEFAIFVLSLAAFAPGSCVPMPVTRNSGSQNNIITKELQNMSRQLSACASLRALAVAASLAALPLLAGAANAQEDKVIAIVDGIEIKQSGIAQATDAIGPNMAQIPEDQRKEVLTKVLIDTHLLANAAKAAGIEDSAEFKKQMDWMRLRALREAYVDQKVNTKLTDKELKDRFDELSKDIKPEKEIRARHILVKTEDEAKKIVTELDGGADFAELAKTKSTGPSGATGGDLGFFGRGRMVPEFDKAVFEMKPGEYSKAPIKTQFGWHVIKMEESRDKPLPPFEQVKEQLRGAMQTEKLQKTLDDLRAKAKIERK